LDALVFLGQSGRHRLGRPAYRLETAGEVDRVRMVLIKANVVHRILRKSINADIAARFRRKALIRPRTSATDPVDQTHRVGGQGVSTPRDVLVGSGKNQFLGIHRFPGGNVKQV
jgi:hypothetical protein